MKKTGAIKPFFRSATDGSRGWYNRGLENLYNGHKERYKELYEIVLESKSLIILYIE
jgi:hypothetical protein